MLKDESGGRRDVVYVPENNRLLDDGQSKEMKLRAGDGERQQVFRTHAFPTLSDQDILHVNISDKESITYRKVYV